MPAAHWLLPFTKTKIPSGNDPNQTGRLTNLMHLNVDTSWYVRCRSSGNPDFGNVFR